MANSKISALTSATTPLAGTETLPIVQGGATVKTTVANITNGGGYAGSFTTLGSTGNTTLGDASTDTVKLNGYMGVGAAATPGSAINIANTALIGSSQYGISSLPIFTSTATTKVASFLALPQTAATTWTTNISAGFYAADLIKGAGSIIINQNGVYIADQTAGTNNYGITSLVSSGTNKWNFYAIGTADNYSAGNWKFAAAKGVNFTANTPAAGMTSQLLNWYEEGTWTPNKGQCTVVGTFSSSGTYTRIGRVVTLRLNLSGSTSITCATGAQVTTNLPYASSTDTPALYINGGFSVSGAVDTSGTIMYAVGTIATTNSIIITATYQV